MNKIKIFFLTCFLVNLKEEILTASQKPSLNTIGNSTSSSTVAAINQSPASTNPKTITENNPSSTSPTLPSSTPSQNTSSTNNTDPSPPATTSKIPNANSENSSNESPADSDEKKPTTAPIANPAIIYTDITNNFSYEPYAPDLELLWNCKYSENIDGDKCLQAQVFFCGRCSRLNCAILKNRAVCLDICGAHNPLMKPCVEAGQRIMTLQELPESPKKDQDNNAITAGQGIDPNMALLGLGLGAAGLGVAAAAAGIDAGAKGLKGLKGPHIKSALNKAGHAIKSEVNKESKEAAAAAKKAAAETAKVAKEQAAAAAKASKEAADAAKKAAAEAAKVAKEQAAATAKASKEAAAAAKKEADKNINSLKKVF